MITFYKFPDVSADPNRQIAKILEEFAEFGKAVCINDKNEAKKEAIDVMNSIHNWLRSNYSRKEVSEAINENCVDVLKRYSHMLK
jgi:NTP pyrophosphatase (non-canonical NTP hydrolase)